MELLLMHLTGDFILQNNNMAVKKKTSTSWCLFHVITYMMPFSLSGLGWRQLLLIAVQHFIQDRTFIVRKFMVWKGSAEFAQPPFAPWSIIVIDNILHLIWIWGVVHIDLGVFF